MKKRERGEERKKEGRRKEGREEGRRKKEASSRQIEIRKDFPPK
jgi:hypothetical protein